MSEKRGYEPPEDSLNHHPEPEETTESRLLRELTESVIKEQEAELYLRMGLMEEQFEASLSSYQGRISNEVASRHLEEMREPSIIFEALDVSKDEAVLSDEEDTPTSGEISDQIIFREQDKELSPHEKERVFLLARNHLPDNFKVPFSKGSLEAADRWWRHKFSLSAHEILSTVQKEDFKEVLASKSKHQKSELVRMKEAREEKIAEEMGGGTAFGYELHRYLGEDLDLRGLPAVVKKAIIGKRIETLRDHLRNFERTIKGLDESLFMMTKKLIGFHEKYNVDSPLTKKRTIEDQMRDLRTESVDLAYETRLSEGAVFVDMGEIFPSKLQPEGYEALKKVHLIKYLDLHPEISIEMNEAALKIRRLLEKRAARRQEVEGLPEEEKARKNVVFLLSDLLEGSYASSQEKFLEFSRNACFYSDVEREVGDTYRHFLTDELQKISRFSEKLGNLIEPIILPELASREQLEISDFNNVLRVIELYEKKKVPVVDEETGQTKQLSKFEQDLLGKDDEKKKAFKGRLGLFKTRLKDRRDRFLALDPKKVREMAQEARKKDKEHFRGYELLMTLADLFEIMKRVRIEDNYQENELKTDQLLEEVSGLESQVGDSALREIFEKTTDLLSGRVEIDQKTYDDFVALKSQLEERYFSQGQAIQENLKKERDEFDEILKKNGKYQEAVRVSEDQARTRERKIAAGEEITLEDQEKLEIARRQVRNIYYRELQKLPSLKEKERKKRVSAMRKSPDFSKELEAILNNDKDYQVLRNKEILLINDAPLIPFTRKDRDLRKTLEEVEKAKNDVISRAETQVLAKFYQKERKEEDLLEVFELYDELEKRVFKSLSKNAISHAVSVFENADMNDPVSKRVSQILGEKIDRENAAREELMNHDLLKLSEGEFVPVTPKLWEVYEKTAKLALKDGATLYNHYFQKEKLQRFQALVKKEIERLKEERERV